jgi:membrane protease YdiL (CAAX protease family)
VKTDLHTPTYPVPRALGLTLVAGLFGLPTLLFAFPGYAISIAGIGWKVATILVAIVAVRMFERRRATRTDLGLVANAGDGDKGRAGVALIGAAAMLALAMFWGEIPGLRELAPAGDATSYGETAKLTTGLLIFELLARYPFQVVAEEAFFRGFLQPRVALAPPVTVGVLFALYHLQQFGTIPSLIPFGIALGLLRWWTGSIWPGVAVHYLGNAMFIMSLR